MKEYRNFPCIRRTFGVRYQLKNQGACYFRVQEVWHLFSPPTLASLAPFFSPYPGPDQLVGPALRVLIHSHLLPTLQRCPIIQQALLNSCSPLWQTFTCEINKKLWILSVIMENSIVVTNYCLLRSPNAQFFLRAYQGWEQLVAIITTT